MSVLFPRHLELFIMACIVPLHSPWHSLAVSDWSCRCCSSGRKWHCEFFECLHLERQKWRAEGYRRVERQSQMFQCISLVEDPFLAEFRIDVNQDGIDIN